jgi:hypothetical protein
MSKTTTTEAEVKKEVQNYLNKLKDQGKLDWIRLNAGKIQTRNKSWIHLGSEGLPDLFILTKEKCFGLELKKPDGKHRDAQEETKKKWSELGVAYWFAHSFEEAKYAIDLYVK